MVNNSSETNNFDEYKFGFDMISNVILSNNPDFKENIQKSLEMLVSSSNAGTIALYQRDKKTNLFHRYSYASMMPSSQFEGIADSCLVNYLNRSEDIFNEAEFDVRYSDKKTHIDIFPVDTLGSYNNILIIINNDIEKNSESGQIIKRALSAILTHKELVEEFEQAKSENMLNKIQNQKNNENPSKKTGFKLFSRKKNSNKQPESRHER